MTAPSPRSRSLARGHALHTAFAPRTMFSQVSVARPAVVRTVRALLSFGIPTVADLMWRPEDSFLGEQGEWQDTDQRVHARDRPPSWWGEVMKLADIETRFKANT